MQAQVLQPICPRPFLKWAGGKSRLIQQYSPYFPREFSRYYEPFLGGGAVFFHLLPRRSFLMDINPELVNVFVCVRDHVDELIERLRFHRDQHCADYYYELRSQQVGNPLERAARLIYLNKTCFNGLYRENSRGHFNVPLGRYKSPPILDTELLYAAARALQFARITAEPFTAVLHQAKTARDFVYFDPPYHPISPTSNFTAYSRHSFNEADQISLRNTFVELSQRGVKVMLSNSDCPFIRDLYQGFPMHTIQASRAINSNGSRRGKIPEVLVTSY